MGIGSMKGGLYPLVRGGGASGGSAAVTGTFTPSFSDPVTLGVTFSYSILNDIVDLWISSSTLLTDTSTATTFATAAGQLPVALRPTVSRHLYVGAADNGVAVACRCVVNATGVLQFAIGQVSGSVLTYSLSGWTASGAKGLQTNFCITYPL